MKRNQNNYIILSAVIVTITILDVVIYKDNYQLSILLLMILGLLSFKQVINLSNNAKQKTFWLVTLSFVIVQMILIKYISIPHMFELLVVNNIIMFIRCTRFLFTPSTLMQNEKKDITYEELLSITRIILFINVLFCIPAYFMVAFTVHESKKITLVIYLILLIMQIIERSVIGKYNHFMATNILKYAIINIILTIIIICLILLNMLDLLNVDYYIDNLSIMILFIPNISFIEIVTVKKT